MKPQPRYHPGDRIANRYLVHQALLGGMGEVYLCLDLEENYPVALKTFQQRYLTDIQRLRRAFEQEVATWVALEKHPNIVQCSIGCNCWTTSPSWVWNGSLPRKAAVSTCTVGCAMTG